MWVGRVVDSESFVLLFDNRQGTKYATLHWWMFAQRAKVYAAK